MGPGIYGIKPTESRGRSPRARLIYCHKSLATHAIIPPDWLTSLLLVYIVHYMTCKLLKNS